MWGRVQFQEKVVLLQCSPGSFLAPCLELHSWSCSKPHKKSPVAQRMQDEPTPAGAKDEISMNLKTMKHRPRNIFQPCCNYQGRNIGEGIPFPSSQALACSALDPWQSFGKAPHMPCPAQGVAASQQQMLRGWEHPFLRWQSIPLLGSSHSQAWARKGRSGRGWTTPLPASPCRGLAEMLSALRHPPGKTREAATMHAS